MDRVNLLPPRKIVCQTKDEFINACQSKASFPTLEFLAADAIKTNALDTATLPEHLSNQLKDQVHPNKFDLTLNFPIEQQDLKILSESDLGAGLTSLSLTPEYSDSSPRITFRELPFPTLENLDVNCQGIHEMDFHYQYTPKLKSIDIDSPSGQSIDKFTLNLPTLERLSLQFIHISIAEEFGHSLSRCPALKIISFYKVWGLGGMAPHLILPSCESLVVNRSDDIDHLVLLWAPKLLEVNFQACYSLRSVRVLNRIDSALEWINKHYPEVGEKIEAKNPAYIAAGPYPMYSVNLTNSGAVIEEEEDMEYGCGYDDGDDGDNGDNNSDDGGVERRFELQGNLLTHSRCRYIQYKDAYDDFYTGGGSDPDEMGGGGHWDGGILDRYKNTREADIRLEMEETVVEDEEVLRCVLEGVGNNDGDSWFNNDEDEMHEDDDEFMDMEDGDMGGDEDEDDFGDDDDEDGYGYD